MGAEVQTHQDPLGIGEVTQNFAHGLRQLAHQSGYGEDLISFGQRRIFEEVNDLNGVFSPGEVLLAEFFEVGERCH